MKEHYVTKTLFEAFVKIQAKEVFELNNKITKLTRLITPSKGIEKVKDRINEIIKENEKTLLLYLKEPDRFIEGKIEGYKSCLKLIDKYIG